MNKELILKVLKAAYKVAKSEECGKNDPLTAYVISDDIMDAINELNK